MDKELPKSELPRPLRKLSIRVNESHLPGNKSCKGSVVWQRTLDIDDIARRVVEKRCEYRPETLVTTFNLLKREIYDAIEEGYNVDFGFGRTELTVNGPFESLYEKFDPRRHTLAPRLRPSPRLRQRVANLRAENETFQLDRGAQPHPAYVSLRIVPRTPDSDEPYNQLPPGEHHSISLYGERLKLAGDDPRVGLYLRRPDGSESRFYPPSEVIVNTGKRLCLTPGFAFTAGEWVAEVVTQYNPSGHHYKTPRYGTLGFTVST
ncbi:DNA-binding domain-containing protein [Parabacteroides sp. ZJ-118]|uniref:DNA-binding domain-containing protein n=1 Tax=Parabacteroides sp. ZJ-118 TaxID=2709398 RepID=UPI0013EB2D17|nr:DNA-binding domain-containing protein [Parabacteroides sp. ZJ-118]